MKLASNVITTTVLTADAFDSFQKRYNYVLKAPAIITTIFLNNAHIKIKIS